MVVARGAHEVEILDEGRTADDRPPEPSATLEVEMLPHAGRLRMDRLPEGAFVMSDALTGERKRMEGTTLELVFDDETGRAALVNHQRPADTKLVEDIMQFDIGVSKNGERFLMSKAGDGYASASFDTLLSKHVRGRVHLKMAGTTASVSIDIALMKHWRPCGQLVFWGLWDVYNMLQLASYNKVASKWAFHQQDAWARSMEDAFPGRHFLLSKHLNLSPAKQRAIDWWDRCLVQTSVSTVGLLWLCCRWAFLAPQKGGMRSEIARDACGATFRSLVELAVPEPGCQTPLKLDLADRWVCLFPRPDTCYSDHSLMVELPFLAGGILVLSPLRELNRSNHILRSLMAALTPPGSDDCPDELCVKDVCHRIAGLPTLEAIVAQIMWFLSRCIESHLRKQHTGALESDGTLDMTGDTICPESPDCEEKLYQYIMSSVSASSSFRCFSISTDKCSPAGMSFQNSTITFANGITVDSGFDCEHLEREKKESAEKRKRDFMELSGPVESESAKRQRAWMNRGDGDMDPKKWRPTVLHRTSAKKWLQAIDNQIRVSTCRSGLAYFCFSTAPEWRTWDSWPCLGVAQDLGSDGVAAANALLYKYDCHMWQFPDPSHAAQRSFDAVLRSLNLWEFFLLMMISYNLEYGPWLEETRRAEVTGAMEYLLANNHASEVPLFCAYSQHIVAELEGAGIVTFPRERPVEEELWSWMKVRARTPPGGRRVAMSRFGVAYHAAAKNLPYWHLQLFERTWVALESNMLTGVKFTEKLKVQATQAEAFHEEGAATKKPGMQLEDRALRNSCKNGIVVSMLTLQELRHKRALACIVEVASVVDSWHTDQNRKLRSVDEMAEWMVSQATDGYMSHIDDFVKKLSHAGCLASAGFDMAVDQVGEGLKHRYQHLDLEILVEDEYADLFGQLVWGFIVERMARGLWLFSWPARLLSCLSSPDQANRTIMQFKGDDEVWVALQARGSTTATEKLLMKRHVFNLRSNKQFQLAFQTEGYTFSQKLAKVLRERSRQNVQTQIVEDINGVQKNSSQLKACRRFRRPSTALATTLEADIVSNRHRFEHVKMDAPVPVFGAKLPDDCFEANKAKLSMSFDEVVSTAASPAWWSPGASNLVVPCADLWMLRWAHKHSEMDRLSKACVGEFVDFTHQTILGFPSETCPFTFEWFVGLRYFSKSSVLLWPIVLKTLPGTDFMVCEPADALHEPILRPIFTLTGIQAYPFVWRSWLWQLRQWPKHVRAMKPAMRMVINSKARGSLLEVACRCAFWNLGKSCVAYACAEFGLEVGATLFDVLWTVIQHVLKTDDRETLRLVHLRIARNHDAAYNSETLLQVDDAVQLLDRYDHEKVKQAKEHVAADKAARETFAASYKAKVVAVAKRAAGKSKASARNRGAAALVPITLPHHIEQHEARKYIPENTSIWRDLARSGWCGHAPPNKRISESFVKHGDSHRALQAILRRLWEQHLEMKGLERSACPISNLWD